MCFILKRLFKKIIWTHFPMPKSISKCFIAVGLLSLLHTGKGRWSKEKENKPRMLKVISQTLAIKRAKSLAEWSCGIIGTVPGPMLSENETNSGVMWFLILVIGLLNLPSRVIKTVITSFFYFLVERTIDGDIARQHFPWVFHGKCIDTNYVLAKILGWGVESKLIEWQLFSGMAV